MRRYDAAAGALIVLACNSVAAPGVGDEFRLRPGDGIRVSGIEMQVTFRSVIADSRCPLRAQCVWAGNGAVVVETDLGGGVRTDTLNTLLEPRVVHLGSVQLELLDLTPYPQTPGGIPAEDYVVTLTTHDVP